MNKKTRAALEKSIAKYRHLCTADTLDLLCHNFSAEGCPLCAIFLSQDCIGCPVQQRTDYASCVGTPWYGAKKGLSVPRTMIILQSELRRKVAAREYKQATVELKRIRDRCYAEAVFLESLRPKEEPSQPAKKTR